MKHAVDRGYSTAAVPLHFCHPNLLTSHVLVARGASIPKSLYVSGSAQIPASVVIYFGLRVDG